MLAEHSGRGTAGRGAGFFSKTWTFSDISGHFGLPVVLRCWRNGSERGGIFFKNLDIFGHFRTFWLGRDFEALAGWL